MKFKHIDSSCHFLELNCRGYNLNVLKLKQFVIAGDIESNPGPSQNHCKSPVGCPKKIKAFKGTAKECDLSENNVYCWWSKGTNLLFQFSSTVKLRYY